MRLEDVEVGKQYQFINCLPVPESRGYSFVVKKVLSFDELPFKEELETRNAVDAWKGGCAFVGRKRQVSLFCIFPIGIMSWWHQGDLQHRANKKGSS